MKIKDIVEKMDLKVLCCKDNLEKEIEDVYCCDLLSWVMSHAKKNSVWITVLVHPNIIAVAQLLEFACIIIPEGISVEEITLSKAAQENIPVLQTGKTSYEICKALNSIGI
jgi:serine kinase of HPr protein (carbohydrate metabolism regulator)